MLEIVLHDGTRTDLEKKIFFNSFNEKGCQIILEKRRDINGVFLGPTLDIAFETISLRK